MTKEWIEQKIREAHDNAVEKGFYDCPECGGTGYCKHPASGCDHLCMKCSLGGCSNCRCSGIDPNKNIGELLMLIVSKLGKALESHKKGKFADWSVLDQLEFKNPSSSMIKTQLCVFLEDIKDTFEDEIADVFIRLFDLCGYLERTPGLEEDGEVWLHVSKNIAEQLLNLTKDIVNQNIFCFFNGLIQFCQHHNIPIQKHIEAKMAYNRTRPHKHGKDY